MRLLLFGGRDMQFAMSALALLSPTENGKAFVRQGGYTDR
jgi:hypothetical protein